MLPQLLVTGVQLIVALIAGLITAIPQLIGAVPQLITAAVDAFKAGLSNFATVGSDIVSGIISGLSGAWGSLVGWLSEKLGGLLDGIKGLLGIASPSKVFANIGENLSKGLAVGIKGSIYLPERELDSMIATVTPKVDDWNWDASLAGGMDLMSSDTTGQTISNYYTLTANYKQQEEMTLIDQVKMLSLLEGV
jgi:hypothetical protein